MSTQNPIAAVRDKLYSRFNIDSGLELVGLGLAITLVLWVVSIISLNVLFRLTEPPGAGQTALAASALFGVLSLIVLLPVTFIGIAAWHDKFTVWSVDTGVFITIAVASILLVLAIIVTGGPPEYGPAMYAFAIIAATLMFAAVFAPAIGAASLTYRHLTSSVSRRQIIGVAVGVLVLVAVGAGAAYGFKMVKDDDRQNTIDTGGDSQYQEPERNYIWDKEWYHENSSVDAYHDYYTVPFLNDDPYVEEQEPKPASQVLPCSSQPSADVFTEFNGTSYGVNRTVVDPSQFQLETWHHTRGDQQIMSHYDFNATESFGGYALKSGMVSHDTVSEANDVYISITNRIFMINASSATIYQDVVTEDGEVVRYGAKLCRPGLE